MVFAFRPVNGWAAKFLLPLRRNVSSTGPFAAVLFQLPILEFASYSGLAVMQCRHELAYSARFQQTVQDERNRTVWRRIA
jgi:hypothetical protein